MLLSPFSSPRRLILLAVFLSTVVIVLIHNSQYSEYLPRYDLPKLGNAIRPGKGVEGENGDGASGTALWKPFVAANSKQPKEQEEEQEHQLDASQLQEHQSDASQSQQQHQTSPLNEPLIHHSTTPVGLGLATPESSDAPEAKVTPIHHPTYQQLKQKILKFIDWTPPNTPDHWPSWSDYYDKDYDPNRWEGLDWENGYFENNGVNELEKAGLSPQPYLPYPDYNSAQWKKEWIGEHVSCLGPRGRNLNESMDEMVKAYHRLPQGFPNITVGSAQVVGIDTDTCIDRDSRYDPYGADYTEEFDWSEVHWGQLQDECLQRNKDRFNDDQRAPMDLTSNRTLPENHQQWNLSYTNPLLSSTSSMPSQNPAQKRHPRTAVLIRTWEGYSYTDNGLHAIRALVTEVSLLSGGEYQLYLLVNVKEREADIYDDPEVYLDVLQRVVPEELRSISVLWTERVCEEWYPKVGDWQVYWQQFMPLQWFSKTHPEFDYIWNWETDARYTGNHYNFLEQISAFARTIPRKYLWERNARFYFPDAHGNYVSYLADTDAAIANATAKGEMTPVWGPMPAEATPAQTPIGPTPPTSQDKDDFSWGVGEEADLITLQPIWDPSRTEWSYRGRIWNYSPGIRPIFTEDDPAADMFDFPGYANIPRRTFINTVARFSKRMLHAMHIENLAGRSMQAEMWPASVALQHGLKAVYAPHPIWADKKWPAWYEDAVFNADGGKLARWGQEFDSPYNHDREAQFRGWSWYYSTSFPRVLYRRFLGWVTTDGGLGELGGEDYEDRGVMMGDGNIVGGHGKMCLPPMLLHPVKRVAEWE